MRTLCCAIFFLAALATASPSFAQTAPALPYPVIAPANQGEIINPVDDQSVSVNLLTGDLYVQLSPLIEMSSESDINLMLGLHYSSGNATSITLGPGWRCTYDIRIAYSYNNGQPTMSLIDFLGCALPFVPAGGGWIAEPSYGCHLTAQILGPLQNPTGFNVSDRWGRLISFDASGRPTMITDFYGRPTALAYGPSGIVAITDQFGRSITFAYAAGRLACVQDATLQGSPVYLSFAYDGAGRLASLQSGYAGGARAMCSFTYVGGGSAMATYTDADGGMYSFSYVAGQVASVTDPLAQSVSVAYGAGSAQVTDRCANSWSYIFDMTVRALSRKDFPAVSGIVYSIVQQFDSSRNLVLRSEPGLSPVASTYDTEGNLLTRSTSYTWSGTVEVIAESWTYSANLVRSYTDGRSNTWHYDWAGPGCLSRIIQPDDNPLTPTHDAVVTYSGGFPLVFRDYRGNSWTFTYVGGRLASSSSPLSNSRTFACNTWGQLTSETDPLGAARTLIYDNMHRLVETREPFDLTGPAITTWVLSPAGRILSITDPIGSATCYSRDAAGRNTEITNPLGNDRALSYDNEGRLTGWTDFRGNIWAATRDAWGRVIAVTDPASHTTATAYDLSARAIAVTNRTGNTSSQLFDGLWRLRRAIDAVGSQINYALDGCGNATSVTDQRGYVTSRTFDELNRLTGQTDPLNFTYSLQYDYNGNLVQATNRLGGVRTATYDADNRPGSFAMPNGTSLTWTCDAAGRVTDVVLPGGGTMECSHNAGGLVTWYKDPSGNETTIGYDKSGRVLSALDSISAIMTFTRDAAGRITAAEYPGGLVRYWSYDNDGNVSSYTDRRGDVWTFSYGALSSCVGILNPEGGNSTLSYDFENRLTSRLDPAGVLYEWAYSNTGRLSSYTCGSSSYAMGYDACGNLTSFTDPGNHAWSYAYNARGERIGATDPLTGLASFSYDGEGNLLSQTDPRGNSTFFAYDSANRRLSAQDALGNTETYSYVGSLLVSCTDRNGRTTGYSYDAAENLVQEQFFDPFGLGTLTRTMAYDLRGNCVSEVGPYVTIERTFDAHDRMTAEEWSPVGFPTSLTANYSYDNEDNLAAITDFAGRTVSYAYNSIGRCTSINDAGQISTMSYDLAGRPVRRDLPSGQFCEWQYLPGSNLVSQESVFDPLGTLQESLDYSYDDCFNAVSKASSSGWSVDWEYDPLERLTGETRTGVRAYIASYAFDAAGNRTNATLNNVSTDYVYNVCNAVVSETTGGNSINCFHDSNGNLTSDSVGNSYVFDYRDRLAGYANGGTLSYRYLHPYEDERAIRTAYAGTPVWSEFTFWTLGVESNVYVMEQGGVPYERERFTHSAELGLHSLTVPPGQQSAGYYPYLSDVEGNVIGLSDNLGNWRNSYEYGAWGASVYSGGQNPVPNEMLFASSRFDAESSMYDMGSREYSRSLARFSAPLALESTGWSGYAYATDNPVNFANEGGLTAESRQLSEDVWPGMGASHTLEDCHWRTPQPLQGANLLWRAGFPLMARGEPMRIGDVLVESAVTGSILEGIWWAAVNAALTGREPRLSDMLETPRTPDAVESLFFDGSAQMPEEYR
ncbi:MAG: RHS repeat-associated core domain-containing protein [Candidatus Brocadiia bacterium]